MSYSLRDMDIDRRINQLTDAVKILCLMHDICPKCFSKMERTDEFDFWKWKCPKCGITYAYNKKYFPDSQGDKHGVDSG